MLATLLKEKCKTLDYSSRQAAKEVGVSHATILRALRGDVIDLETLIKMSDWLNVKPHTLRNTFSSFDAGLADRIAVIIDRHPKLRSVFAKAIELIVNDEADPYILDDIAAYAVYRLDLYEK